MSQPRIVSELQKLGIGVARSAVEKYKPRAARPLSTTSRAFLSQHAKELVAADFFIVPTVTFRMLFVFLVLAHNRRRTGLFNETEHPTAPWVAQQAVKAFPLDTALRYLRRDGDGNCGDWARREFETLDINEVVTAPAPRGKTPMFNARSVHFTESLWTT